MHIPRTTLILPLALAACLTEQTSAPPHLEDAVVTSLAPAAAWVVEEGGRTRGSVLLFEEGGDGHALYVVRNEHRHDLGTIDRLGRARRLRPHEEPLWVGTGPVLDGVRLILDLGPGASLRPVPVHELREGPEPR